MIQSDERKNYFGTSSCVRANPAGERVYILISASFKDVAYRCHTVTSSNPYSYVQKDIPLEGHEWIILAKLALRMRPFIMHTIRLMLVYAESLYEMWITPDFIVHFTRGVAAPGGGGGTQIWFRRGCAAEAAKPVPIFKGQFGGKGFPLLRVFSQKNDVFVYFSDEIGENI